MKQLLFAMASCLAVLSACTKEEETETSSPTLPPPTGKYSASYSIDGRSVSFTDGITGFITPSAYMARYLRVDSFYVRHSLFDSVKVHDTTLLIRSAYTLSLRTRGGIERLFVTTDTVSYIDSSSYNALRPSYGAFTGHLNRSGISFANGARIVYFAPDSSMWTSAGAQPASAVLNLGLTESGMLSNGTEYAKASVSFTDITLYKVNSTETKTLSSGNVSGYFVNSK